jgi:nitrogen regulatory protein PII
MKLLLITAIQEFEKDIKQILKKSDVKIFSYKNVKGYRDSTEETMESNWFASEMNINESLLFYAFVPKKNVDKVFNLVAEFNEKQESMSHIHLAMLNIEKSN